MSFSLPDFKDMPDDELRRVIANFEFQRDVAADFLARAEAEVKHRKQDRREGIFRSAPMPVDEPTPRKPH